MSDHQMKRRLGELAEQTRTENNESRVKFAERAGLALNTVRNFEKGETWPQAHTITRIVDALGWRPRATEIMLNSKKAPEEVTLDDLRDPDPWGRKVNRAADLSDEELLTELTSRLTQKSRLIEQLQKQPTRDAFDLAAYRDGGPQRLEFEAPSDRGEEPQD